MTPCVLLYRFMWLWYDILVYVLFTYLRSESGKCRAPERQTKRQWKRVKWKKIKDPVWFLIPARFCMSFSYLKEETRSLIVICKTSKCFCVCVCCLSVKRVASNPGRFANATLVRLSEHLSLGYKKGVRPVKDWRNHTTVSIDLMVYSILNVVSGSTGPDTSDF